MLSVLTIASPKLPLYVNSAYIDFFFFFCLNHINLFPCLIYGRYLTNVAFCLHFPSLCCHNFPCVIYSFLSPSFLVYYLLPSSFPTYRFLSPVFSVLSFCSSLFSVPVPSKDYICLFMVFGSQCKVCI